MIITVFFLPNNVIYLYVIILPVIICCDQGEGGEESEQRRQFSMEEEPSQEAAGKHAYISVRRHVHVCSGRMSASMPGGNSLSKNFPVPAPDAAVSSTDVEKEDDENSFQAQTAADEGSVKVPAVLINLCRQHEHGLFFLQCSVCVCLSTSVPPLFSCV